MKTEFSLRPLLSAGEAKAFGQIAISLVLDFETAVNNPTQPQPTILQLAQQSLTVIKDEMQKPADQRDLDAIDAAYNALQAVVMEVQADPAKMDANPTMCTKEAFTAAAAIHRITMAILDVDQDPEINELDFTSENAWLETAKKFFRPRVFEPLLLSSFAMRRAMTQKP